VTRGDSPQDWAISQRNLSRALKDQAKAASGPDRVRLLSEAVAASNSALEVYTRDALPRDWALTQINLAEALRDQAGANEGAERARLLLASISACHSALEVLTEADFPSRYADIMRILNEVESALRELQAAGK
jgi:hypothetical protein